VSEIDPVDPLALDFGVIVDGEESSGSSCASTTDSGLTRRRHSPKFALEFSNLDLDALGYEQKGQGICSPAEQCPQTAGGMNLLRSTEAHLWHTEKDDMKKEIRRQISQMNGRTFNEFAVKSLVSPRSSDRSVTLNNILIHSMVDKVEEAFDRILSLASENCGNAGVAVMDKSLAGSRDPAALRKRLEDLTVVFKKTLEAVTENVLETNNLKELADRSIPLTEAGASYKVLRTRHCNGKESCLLQFKCEKWFPKVTIDQLDEQVLTTELKRFEGELSHDRSNNGPSNDRSNNGSLIQFCRRKFQSARRSCSPRTPKAYTSEEETLSSTASPDERRKVTSSSITTRKKTKSTYHKKTKSIYSYLNHPPPDFLASFQQTFAKMGFKGCHLSKNNSPLQR